MMRPTAICLVFVAVVTTARADVWYVDDDYGNDCPGSGSAGDPFCHIRDAIDAAVSGDEIVVRPGEYDEQVSFGGKAIALRSSGGPLVTTLDGRNTGRVVTCQDITAAGTVLEGFTITGGEAVSGGGMFVRNSDLTVIDCIFLGNTAGEPIANENAYGGAMYLSESNATVVNCSFLGNSASVDVPAPTVKAWGGGIYMDGGSLTVINSTFSGNSVSAETMGMPGFSSYAYGGGIGNKGGDLRVTNCTFTGNSASAYPQPHQALGAGVCAPSGGTTSVTNCIFYANTSGTPESGVHGAVTVDHSCLQLPHDGSGNLWGNPMLVDADGVDGVFGTEDDDVHLQADSPCINTGDNDAIVGHTAADFEGDDRVVHCRVDMGVDETPHIGADCNGNGSADACEPSIVYVDDDAPSGGDGHTWANARDDLQTALASLDCVVREVRVAGGTYKPGTARTDTFQLMGDVAIRGGYRGLAGGGNPNDRWSESILSGDIGTTGVSTDNSYHVVTGSGTGSTAILEGFTITAGNADGDEPYNSGGGMYVSGGSPTVKDCMFSGNKAGNGGGMANTSSSSPKVIGCTFTGNSAGPGGGMNNDGSSPRVERCTFSGNSASLGGGINSDWSSPRVDRCKFIGNSATYGGGGMYNYESPSIVTNCTFSGNIADDPFYDCRGGGLRNESSDSAVITNCTFSGNEADEGCGMYTSHGDATVTNCILWGNTGHSGPPIEDGLYATTTVQYSCVQAGWPGNGNIPSDPLLVDADGPDGDSGTDDDDLHLLPGSPCINTGLPAAPELPERDLDGHARVLCGIVDMGAYEFGIGDFRCDQDVDLSDFVTWETCMTGPSAGPYPILCEAFDFKYDGDVDLDDFALFQRAFGGTP